MRCHKFLFGLSLFGIPSHLSFLPFSLSRHPCTLARRIGDYGDQSSLSDIIGESFNTGVVDAIGNPVWGYRYFPDPICELLQPGKMHFADSLNGVVKDVAVGGFHMLVVVSKKSSTGTSVYTCGRNDCGQLGLGDKTTREILTKVCDASSIL